MNSSPKQAAPIKVGLISLGCAKNLVDAEIMLGSLMKSGVEITSDAASADVVIVNTCSFIDAAQEESVDTILESVELREAKNRGQGLIVSGCLPQRFRDDLPKLLPEVDAFMGIDQVAQVSEIVQQALQHRASRLEQATPVKTSKKRITATLEQMGETISSNHATDTSLRGTLVLNRTRTVMSPAAPIINVNARPVYIPDYSTPRFRLTPKHFAYLKVAEGCNHPCSFCIIPRMRGSHRSRAQGDVVQEARQLLSEGVKEINLISQDSTYYGLDLRPKRDGSIASPEKFRAAAQSLPADATTLCTLLRELDALPGKFWIRLLYTHPAHWTDELIETIASCPKVARYIDMPLQHIHPTMLERMRRETSERYIIDLIARIRARIPGITLRTTFIVGFPGETEAYFESLLEFIRDTKFERMGVFTYSHEEGTRAGAMTAQVPEKMKQKRRQQAMSEQLKVSREAGKRFVGRDIEVLVERAASDRDLKNACVNSWEHGLIRGMGEAASLSGSYLVARGEADAPDIDGRVYITGSKASIGEFTRVKVIGHTDYDLIAQPA